MKFDRRLGSTAAEPPVKVVNIKETLRFNIQYSDFETLWGLTNKAQQNTPTPLSEQRPLTYLP